MTRAKDDAIEQRIEDEVVVDAHNAEERALGWFYYLDGHLNVPFKARCRHALPGSPLRAGDIVDVLGMAPEWACDTDMLVRIRRGGKQVGVPLAQLKPLSNDRETREAADDWHYWVDRGYAL